MNTRLDRIKNWGELAKRAKFRVATLANECQVTDRQLERYFRFRFRMSARDWMTRKRLEIARGLLLAGSSIKWTAAEVAYAKPGHFARAFKRFYGMSPSALR